MWVGLIQSVKGLESKSSFPKAKGILYQGYHVEILNFQPALQIWDLPAPTVLPGKSHGWRSLVGCSPWGPWGSDTTVWLPFHFSLSCIGEGNGNPLQCSCLRIPGTESLVCCHLWVAQSRTRLKQLSSSSSSLNKTGLLSVCAEGSIYPKCLSTLAGG